MCLQYIWLLADAVADVRSRTSARARADAAEPSERAIRDSSIKKDYYLQYS